MKNFWRALIAGLAIIGFMVVLSVASVLYWSNKLADKANGLLENNAMQESALAPLPNSFVLALNIDGAFTQSEGDMSLRQFKQLLNPEAANLRHVIHQIEEAALDPRVKGLALYIADAPPISQVQDLQEILTYFKSKNKKIWVFADTYGEISEGNAEYLLASMADSIWIQPTGFLGLTGFATEQLFFNKTLKNYGIIPEFVKRTSYKTAMDQLTESGITPTNKEMLTSIIGDLTNQLVTTIANRRHISVEKLKEVMENAPLQAKEAKQAGLIDEIGYEDQFDDFVAGQLQGKAKDVLVELDDYTSPAAVKIDQRVALIYAEGPIARMAGQGKGSLLGSDELGLADVLQGLQEATENPLVQVIILRIDSPGGSAVASDSLRRAVEKARLSGKIILASMGAMAGSGGYMAVMNANQIFAEPSTLTGSIGVISGKINISGLLQKLDIATATIASTQNGAMWSAMQGFTQAQKQKLNGLADAIYDDFSGDVAKARHLDIAARENWAAGRVWTGKQALEKKLVDQLGGFYAVLQAAREKVGEKPYALLTPALYPQKEPLLREMLKKFVAKMGMEETSLQPLWQGARAINLWLKPIIAPETMMLSMPH